MADDALDAAFIERIPEIIRTLTPTVADVPLADRRWVFYGSPPDRRRLPLGCSLHAR